MSKHDDIEQEVWDSAGGLGDEITLAIVGAPHLREFNVKYLIARAILSERTKAAEIAESYYEKANEAWVDTGSYADKDAADTLLELSQAIRKGGKE